MMTIRYFLPGQLAILFTATFLLAGCLHTSGGSKQALRQEVETIKVPEILSGQEETTIPEPELTVSEEAKELAELGSWEEGSQLVENSSPTVTYDFPVTVNKQVEYYLDFFQNRQAATFRRWLERSGRYLPMIHSRLAEAGLPLDLAYLPMIESGYSLTAYSRARAAGPWQFIRSTGRHYGLKVNSYEDERRDPIKATDAAIAFLSDLYREFGDWHLAVAAYNAGGGKIQRGLKRYKVDNFWDLAQKRYLRNETKLYVPKLIAAIMIAKEPAKYGFADITYQQPLAYETVDVPRWTSLRAIAVASNVDFDIIRNLNRQLRKRITPPNVAAYPIKIPPGKGEQLRANLERVYPMVATKYRTHTVRSQETLSQICRRYNLQKLTLLKANNLTSAQLKPGQRLRIPYQTTTFVLWDKEGLPPQAEAGSEMVLHKVRQGDSVSRISRLYNVPQHMIVVWNNLPSMHEIRAGQQLAIYLNDASQAPSNQQLAVLQEATLPAGIDTSKGKPFYYQVQQGDSLWTISQRFNLSIDQIRRWNSLKNDMLHPGTRLLVRAF